jgi:hypothetical protein
VSLRSKKKRQAKRREKTGVEYNDVKIRAKMIKLFKN